LVEQPSFSQSVVFISYFLLCYILFDPVYVVIHASSVYTCITFVAGLMTTRIRISSAGVVVLVSEFTSDNRTAAIYLRLIYQVRKQVDEHPQQ
jgi:hypothetical protein